MLRSRSKRSSWAPKRSELPVSDSSKPSAFHKLRINDSTTWNSNGLVYRVFRYLKPLLFLSFLLLLLFLLLYAGLTNTPASERLAQFFAFGPSTQNSALHISSNPDKKPLPPGKPPMVDRSILEKLALMDPDSDDPDERPAPSARDKYAWPPAVMRIPEPSPPTLPSTPVHHQFQHVPISTASPAEFDLSICGENICQFILPLRIAEQESKARLHFTQILELARLLDRIVVLPNVGKSRMGTCLKWTFEKYYDSEAFQARAENDTMRVIDMETFRRWTATRPMKPNAQIVSIDSKPRSDLSSSSTLFIENGLTVKIEQDQDPSDPKYTRCLNSKFPRLALDVFSPLSIHPSRGLKNRPIGTRIVNALLREDVQEASIRTGDAAELVGLDEFIESQEQDEEQQDEEQDERRDDVEPSSDPDVLILDYDLRHPAFSTPLISSPPHPTLSYSPTLIALADNLLTPLKPADYLVIHWRMETVPPDVLPRCAELLVNTLAGLLGPQVPENENNSGGTVDIAIKTVWFASDYPYPITRTLSSTNQHQTQEDGGSKSGTFRGVGIQHEEAAEVLRSAFEEGGVHEGRKITGLAEAVAKVREDRLRGAAGTGGPTGVGLEGGLMEDAGVLGILDKIVASRASLFVSGGKTCGRVRYVVCFVFGL